LRMKAEEAVLNSVGMEWTQCPIGKDFLRDPVMCADGHTYSRKNIEEWMNISRKSPITNLPMRSFKISNYAAASALDAVVESKIKEIHAHTIKMESGGQDNFKEA